jgi:hypothetical protein
MISSPSAQIVNAIAESSLITGPDGKKMVPSYGPVMGIATAIIAIGIIITVAPGPEKRGRKFENALIAGARVADQKAKLEDVEGGESKPTTHELEERK